MELTYQILFAVLLVRLLAPLSVIMSIGLSNMIELYLNPTVHKQHNCPRIMKIPWKDYNGFHAMWTGIKCSWFLILPLCVFSHSSNIIFALDIINVLIPVFCFITGLDKSNPYNGHNIMYIINFSMLFISTLGFAFDIQF